MRFQRKNLIETDSSSEDTDDAGDTMALMDNGNPQIRLAVFAKTKKIIGSYREHKVKAIDRRLIRGLFVRNLKDFDEEYRERVKDKSLLERVTQAMTI